MVATPTKRDPPQPSQLVEFELELDDFLFLFPGSSSMLVCWLLPPVSLEVKPEADPVDLRARGERRSSLQPVRIMIFVIIK